jgi:HSP20 family protein
MSSRRNPFEELERMIERMNRQLEAATGSGRDLPAGGGGSASVDVVDAGDAFEVTVDLPGFEKEDIELRVDGNRLHLSAERETEREEGEDRYVRRERSRRSVSRSLTLPGEVAEAEVEAHYRNGVLTVTLPKADRDEGGHEIEVS